jgi:uncharacterized protein YqgV (UPF0045/DUF77 family)
MEKLIDLDRVNPQATREVEQQDDVRVIHTVEIDKRKRDIHDKIKSLEAKLQKHTLKEGMLDNIIAGTYRELEEVKPNEFTRRGQKQTILIKQLEALGLLHDTLMKYEDMIQKYHKILIDIENNKVNTFVRLESLKQEEKLTEESLSNLMGMVQEQLKNGAPGENSAANPLLAEIQAELDDGNY